MGKPYKRKGSPKFVQLFRWLTQSDAWRACSPVERVAYLELKERYNGHNNGQIGLSVRDLADALLSSKDTASRALKGLQAKGFITVMKRSAFSVKNRTSTEYRLTEYACDITGDLATKDFMKWRPEKNSSPIRRTYSPTRRTAPLPKAPEMPFTVRQGGP